VIRPLRVSGLQQRESLSRHKKPAAGPAVGQQAAEQAERQHGRLSDKPDQAEQEWGAGEAVDQPALGEALHPRAAQRESLAGEEEAEITVTERAER
jgi:hypothetical protein